MRGRDNGTGKDRTATALRWASLPLLLLLWAALAEGAGSRLLPGPLAVALRAATLWREGDLARDFGWTLLRSGSGFGLAMAIGTAAGLALGRYPRANALFGPWLTVGLNLPAVVVGIACFIWLGLDEVALVAAVTINKVPLVATLMREGVQSLDPAYGELARALRMPAARRVRLILLPQLLPFLIAAARTGLALIWKIVLVFEVLGADRGVGFRVSVFFQYFDMAGILAYALGFVGVVLAVEALALRPIDRRLARWRMAPN
jgi:NitT/TauT family transport system permease protein